MDRLTIAAISHRALSYSGGLKRPAILLLIGAARAIAASADERDQQWASQILKPPRTRPRRPDSEGSP